MAAQQASEQPKLHYTRLVKKRNKTHILDLISHTWGISSLALLGLKLGVGGEIFPIFLCSNLATKHWGWGLFLPFLCSNRQLSTEHDRDEDRRASHAWCVLAWKLNCFASKAAINSQKSFHGSLTSFKKNTGKNITAPTSSLLHRTCLWTARARTAQELGLNDIYVTGISEIRQIFTCSLIIVNSETMFFTLLSRSFLSFPNAGLCKLTSFIAKRFWPLRFLT